VGHSAGSSEPLRTIGYEGTTLDAVARTLAEAGVDLLIDVRAIASSRKPGFSKRVLAASLVDAGIDYLHLRPLGTPKAGREAVRRGDPATMRRIFAAHMNGDEPQAALAEARHRSIGARACLLCFERDHRTCHRAIVADMISAQTGQHIEHLIPPMP
jgi:uncharacterized protein (DUF488 family)